MFKKGLKSPDIYSETNVFARIYYLHLTRLYWCCVVDLQLSEVTVSQKTIRQFGDRVEVHIIGGTG